MAAGQRREPARSAGPDLRFLTRPGGWPRRDMRFLTGPGGWRCPLEPIAAGDVGHRLATSAGECHQDQSRLASAQDHCRRAGPSATMPDSGAITVRWVSMSLRRRLRSRSAAEASGSSCSIGQWQCKRCCNSRVQRWCEKKQASRPRKCVPAWSGACPDPIPDGIRLARIIALARIAEPPADGSAANGTCEHHRQAPAPPEPRPGRQRPAVPAGRAQCRAASPALRPRGGAAR
jgi:hypothetical protein